SKTVRSPLATEIQLLDGATQLAGIAIERKHTENRIRYMGDHDALTGLPNRLLLEDRLKQAIIYAQRFGRLVTVAFIDLDKFKLVNDSLGHSAGDELLKTVASRMVKSVRRTDTVVRLGGDEFVIILFDQPSDAEDITSVLQNIQESILQPIHLSGHTLHVTCSMGLATYPADGIDTDTLLRNADAAMYRSKEMGRNGYQFYTHEMNTRHQGKLALQDGLRNAIENEEFLLLYQPQIDLHTGQIIGVEALIRWQHPDLGIVSPIKFISQAEETGLIVPIGDWVIHSACLQAKAWQDAGLPPITMSVNISARQFIERDLIHRVEHALLESNLEPMYLELELTESLIMQDLQQAISKMEKLQAMGVRLSIDDFGTGYSSLAALKSFPIVRLKIDQSFIRDLPDNENDKAIATAVISLGHKLNLKVIAEGVETEAQQVFLRENGCDEMQGYLFSKPVLAREIEQLFKPKNLSAEAHRG
ncbi:EAL domain-containing protein, partial [Pseudomonas sp. CCC3.2]